MFSTHCARELLKEAARLRKTVNYMTLGNYVGNHRFQLEKLLNAIAEVDQTLGLPPLCTLVTYKADPSLVSRSLIEHLETHCFIPDHIPDEPKRIVDYFQQMCFDYYQGRLQLHGLRIYI
jgi:hypothetical protein